MTFFLIFFWSSNKKKTEAEDSKKIGKTNSLQSPSFFTTPHWTNLVAGNPWQDWSNSIPWELLRINAPPNENEHHFLVGGFKYFLVSTLLGEMIQFDYFFFQMGWNHQLV